MELPRPRGSAPGFRLQPPPIDPADARRFAPLPPDFRQLSGSDSATAYYMGVGIGSDTRSSYAKPHDAFESWCRTAGLTAFPSTAHHPCLCSASLADGDARQSTIRNYLAGLRSLHVELGLVDLAFDGRQVARPIRGLRRDLGYLTACAASDEP